MVQQQVDMVATRIQEHMCSSVRQAGSGSIGQIRYKGAGKRIVRDKPNRCRRSSFFGQGQIRYRQQNQVIKYRT
ncbi:unnamed protein product, partial [Staurois parvus]